MEPMIDCVFLMLIFFLIAATIKKKHQELPIVLAQAGGSDEVVSEDDLGIISILKGGELVYSTVAAQASKGAGANEPVSKQKLLERLDTLSPSQRIRLDIDVGTTWKSVVEVVNMLEVRQLNNIGIRTASKKRR